MGPKYQALKGMDDILPGEIEKWQWLEAQARIFLEARGYKEIRTPLLEPLELFARTLGEGSDIVHKEMYAFKDRGERDIALRPEMTASVARAVTQNHLLKQTRSLRLYYIGSMFRGERPQAGRKRQFHQIGIELINEAGAKADGEAISVLWHFLNYVGLKDSELRLNHLGCAKDRPHYISSLKDYFTKEKDKLCSDCHYRLEKNVLRIFDCKNASCQPIIQKAPPGDLCSVCRKNFDELGEILKKEYGIAYKIEGRLVRGMDYYTGIVFEVSSAGLGAQDAVAGGGRYDGLYESLGGGEVPATGFSIGMERLLQTLKIIGPHRIYFASLVDGPKLRGASDEQILRLREAGFPVEITPHETSLSAHLKRANQLGIRYVLICGDDELKEKKLSLKDLEKHTQQQIEISKLIPTLKELL
ncbi:MAG: histidine--tRNA ligase [Candidatus Omnitrophica bacterium]|nr:histidine--tRNA ligase [Candidatus Omnitrophota bacterium]